MGLFILLTAVLACEALYLSLLCFKDWKAKPETLVLLFVLYSAFLWSLVPALGALLSGEFLAFNFGYEIETWNFGLWLEVVFFAVFILGWHISDYFKRKPIPPITQRDMKFVIWIAIIAGIAYFALGGFWTNAGYEILADYVNGRMSTEDATQFSTQSVILQGIIIPACFLLLFYLPKSLRSKWISRIAVVVLILSGVKAIGFGTRYGILAMAFSLATCLLMSGRIRASLKYFGVGFVAAAVLSAAMVAIRGTAETQDMSNADRAAAMLKGKHGDLLSKEWFISYLPRLDAVQNSGIIATHLHGDYAGLTPFTGAFLTVIPRTLWPSKPLALSRDGTIFGQPSFLCMAYRGEPWNSSTVSTSGVAYWQFGWIGVILTGLITGMSTRFLGVLAFRKGAIGAFLFLAYCGVARFRIPLALDEFIVAISQVWVPIFGLYLLYRFALQTMNPATKEALNRATQNVIVHIRRGRVADRDLI